MRVRCTVKECKKEWDPVREAGEICFHSENYKTNTVVIVPHVKYQLVATDPLLAHAFATQFRGCPLVEVTHGNILDYEADAIVSPANSFGQMQGGIDLAYLKYFGYGLQERVYETYRHVGRTVPVGQAVMTLTSNERAPYLISAPTMYAPMNVEDTFNAYWAMKAVLQFVLDWNLEQVHMVSTLSPIKQRPINKVLVPGLCTGTGKMHPDTAARQMRKAYAEIELRGFRL